MDRNRPGNTCLKVFEKTKHKTMKRVNGNRNDDDDDDDNYYCDSNDDVPEQSQYGNQSEEASR